MTQQNISVTNRSYTVGNNVYGRRENPDQHLGGLEKTENYFNTAIGTFRSLKFIDLVPAWINAAQVDLGYAPSAGLQALSAVGKAGWKGMGFARAYTGGVDAYNEYLGRNNGITNPEIAGQQQPKSSAQSVRQAVDFVNKGFDAAAMVGYSGALVAGCFKSTAAMAGPIAQVADGLGLIHDTADFAGAVQDTYLAGRVQADLVNSGQAVDSDIVNSFRETKVNAALRVAKTALAVFGGLATFAAVLGVLKISVVAALTISLITQIFAVAITFHKMGMKEKPINVVNYYDLARPAIPVQQPPASRLATA